MMPTLEERIVSAAKQGRCARIPFVTAGFPTREHFVPLLRELDECGADIIEVGIPFSDPVADGPVVEEASRRALENGVTLGGVLQELAELSPRLVAGLVLMGYYNPFYQYGLERLVDEAEKAGVQGFIVPDLPLGEDGEFRALLARRGMDLIALVGPNTSEERMREYAATASGYVYAVSVLGTTGARDTLPDEVANTLTRVKQCFSLPVALGFGIQRPEQIRAMKVKPDAAVFGSALMRHVSEGKGARAFMEPWL